MAPGGRGNGRLRRHRVAPQRRLVAHQAGREAVGPADRGSLGRAAPRHRQTQDASHRRRRKRDVPRSRRGRRRRCFANASPTASASKAPSANGSTSSSSTTSAPPNTTKTGPTPPSAASTNKWTEGLRDLLDLSRADITTKRPEKRRRGVRQISLLAKRIRDLQEEDDKVAPLPKGLGTAIMEAFGVPPSKRLGDLMKQLTAAAEAGEVEAEKPAEYYIDYLAAHRETVRTRRPRIGQRRVAIQHRLGGVTDAATGTLPLRPSPRRSRPRGNPAPLTIQSVCDESRSPWKWPRTSR